MANSENLTVALAPETARLLHRALGVGKYPDADTLIDAAVRSLKVSQDVLSDYSPAELDRLWEEGVASGPGHFESFEALKQEARRQVDEASKPRP